MSHLTPIILTVALVMPFSAWAQGEIQFNRSQSTVQIDRVFVLAGESNPCQGVEIDAQAVAEYAEVRLLSQYEILERKHLEMILKEQSLGMSGLVFEDQAVDAGCLQGSEGVVFCEVGCLSGQSMVKLKLVDCKESVQQWSALGIDVKMNALFDRIDAGQGIQVRVPEPLATNLSEVQSQVAPVNVTASEAQTFSCGDQVSFDHYAYNTVQIGQQCWFAENLRTTVYASGKAIPATTEDWKNIQFGARCDYDNDARGVETYGRLYNWYAVDNPQGLCPMGWHVPTDLEWADLEGYIASQGYNENEGVALKESPEAWGSTEDRATNSFGFSALPGGNRYDNGNFKSVQTVGNWWSSSLKRRSAWSRSLYSSDAKIRRYYLPRGWGLSVRCLRDAD